MKSSTGSHANRDGGAGKVFGLPAPPVSSVVPLISYPHLSHAYAGAEGHLADRGALKVTLSDLPGDPVTVPVTTLTLVAEWHDRREITWDVLAEVPLGGRA